MCVSTVWDYDGWPPPPLLPPAISLSWCSAPFGRIAVRSGSVAFLLQFHDLNPGSVYSGPLSAKALAFGFDTDPPHKTKYHRILRGRITEFLVVVSQDFYCFAECHGAQTVFADLAWTTPVLEKRHQSPSIFAQIAAQKSTFVIIATRGMASSSTTSEQSAGEEDCCSR